jgi:FAD-NAD(P)-binding
MTRVIIIGGGASGVLLAVHLMRGLARRLETTIIERPKELGAGIAYATNHPDHLLNFPASNMSAFPDDPGHFVRWLAARHPAHSYGAGRFRAAAFLPRFSRRPAFTAPHGRKPSPRPGGSDLGAGNRWRPRKLARPQPDETRFSETAVRRRYGVARRRQKHRVLVTGLGCKLATTAQRQPSAGATWVRIASMTCAL